MIELLDAAIETLFDHVTAAHGQAIKMVEDMGLGSGILVAKRRPTSG